MVEISVIVPIYNVEDFLGECLNSIVNQTFKDIEIICINDGSTDKSLEILNDFANQDERFTVISQENQGHAVATNRGISLAQGKYLYLMDSDDILELTALEETYNYAEEKDVDFLIFKAMNYVMDEDRYYESEIYSLTKALNLVGDKVFNYKDLGDLIFDIPVTPWSKLYKTDFIKNCGAKFPEGLVFDDNIFFFDILFYAKRICIYPKFLFIRRWYTYSSTTAGDKRFLDSIDINNLTIDLFKKHGVFEEYKRELYNRKVNLGNYRFVRIKDEFKDLFFEKLQNDFKGLVENGLYDDYLNNLNERNKFIFQSCLASETASEFKYKILYYDSKNRNSSLEGKVKSLEEKNSSLEGKVKNLENENTILKNKLDSIKNKKVFKLYKKFKK